MKKYLLDTNSIIYALNSSFKFPNVNNYSFSIITEIELLSYSKLSQEDEKILRNALSNFDKINISEQIKEETIKIRRSTNLKLPDSLIIATVYNATLVTPDKQLLNNNLVKVIKLNDINNKK